MQKMSLSDIVLQFELDKLREEVRRLKFLTAHQQHEINHIQKEIHYIFHLLKHNQNQIQSFTIHQQGDPMALLAIAPGNSPVFTATPVPSTSVPSTPPTWVSSDTTNAPITASADGLSVTVAIPTTATVGTAFTLTISYTNADGTVATGTTTQTIVPAPSPDITSFTIAQTV